MASRKYSRQREMIRDNLRGRTDHPTAEAVYEDLRLQDPHISLGTVYRNLALLSDSGEIVKLAIQGQPDRFDYRTDDHSHMICRDCGRVVDLEVAFPELDRAAQKVFAGTIDSHVCYFYGRCPACAGGDEG